jgi:hypothetical protein
MQERTEERPLGELLGELSTQMTTLVRQEIDLARTEMTAKAAAAGRSAAIAGAGGVVVHAAFLALVFATVALLTTALDLDVWLSALIVAAVLAVVGALLIQRGRAGLARTSLAPERTIRTLKEDAEWASDRTK